MPKTGFKHRTPETIAKIVFNITKGFIKDTNIILDPACGDGLLLEQYKDNKTFGTDIRKDALDLAKNKKITIFEDNFFINTNRDKYNKYFKPHKKICIISYPTYTNTDLKECNLGKKDIGIHYINNLTSLDPEFVCLVHPLSYLIKESNRKLLRTFFEKYQLTKAVIFPSSELGTGCRTVFPCVVALYDKKTTENNISTFVFDIHNTDKKISFAKIKTTDTYGIRKYPPKQNEPVISETGLYMFNFRDTNSLITSGALTDKTDEKSYITIKYDDIFHYTYLNCYKKLYQSCKDKNSEFYYLLNNFAPLFDKESFSEKIAWASFFYFVSVNKDFKKIENGELIFETLKRNKPYTSIYKLFREGNVESLKQIMHEYVTSTKEKILTDCFQ